MLCKRQREQKKQKFQREREFRLLFIFGFYQMVNKAKNSFEITKLFFFSLYNCYKKMEDQKSNRNLRGWYVDDFLWSCLHDIHGF